MNAEKLNQDKIILELSKEELGILGNALNEICNGIEILEFDKRMGINIEDAGIILKTLVSIYWEVNRYIPN